MPRAAAAGGAAPPQNPMLTSARSRGRHCAGPSLPALHVTAVRSLPLPMTRTGRRPRQSRAPQVLLEQVVVVCNGLD